MLHLFQVQFITTVANQKKHEQVKSDESDRWSYSDEFRAFVAFKIKSLKCDRIQLITNCSLSLAPMGHDENSFVFTLQFCCCRWCSRTSQEQSHAKIHRENTLWQCVHYNVHSVSAVYGALCWSLGFCMRFHEEDFRVLFSFRVPTLIWDFNPTLNLEISLKKPGVAARKKRGFRAHENIFRAFVSKFLRWSHSFHTINFVFVMWLCGGSVETHLSPLCVRMRLFSSSFSGFLARSTKRPHFLKNGKHTNRSNNTINYLNGLMKTSNDFSIELHKRLCYLRLYQQTAQRIHTLVAISFTGLTMNETRRMVGSYQMK